jgi:hypothetical protein
MRVKLNHALPCLTITYRHFKKRALAAQVVKPLQAKALETVLGTVIFLNSL